ncbi:hypothetical protein CVT26_006778 [Gymnopilus dilepis]|uniref:phosphatidylserine decarboxylase n=1 Tax=Gymnopilus dilepis TaxID=231916 RepID=A0A409Y3A2_9AGAR|nr:hypothetical protein CVT26_006778 [Gymnopilus dilepis]
MSTLRAKQITKPIDPIRSEGHPLGDVKQEAVIKGLSKLVATSADEPDVGHHILAPVHTLNKSHFDWIRKLIPGIERVAVEYHVGNFVAIRGTDEKVFESMPLYAREVRLGMHLLFYGKEQRKLLSSKRIYEILEEQSIKQGKIFDSPKSAKSIPSFISTYNIPTDELLEPDISKYRTFNEFFYRKLKPGARPVQDEADHRVIVSAADCRLTVYPSIDLAKQIWVKGKNFSVPNLLNLPPTSPKLQSLLNSHVAIFRLAPADYHRFHSPIDCEVGDIEHVPGRYYTVNPQAVNEPNFDVLTANVRSILYLKHIPSGKMVAFVAIGALLVGSIIWTGGKEKGAKLKRGDELGHFAYGGSTIAVVFPKEVMEFDEDLVVNSEKPIETLVRVGESIGKFRGPSPSGDPSSKIGDKDVSSNAPISGGQWSLKDWWRRLFGESF